MIIECKNCLKRFTVKDSDIPFNGRTVKCGNCSTIWLQLPIAGSIKIDYLKMLREKTEKIDSILILDEVITGFRLAFGGAQEYYNIKPDLCTFGKISGGGFPIGGITGLKEIMEKSKKRWHTYGQRRS